MYARTPFMSRAVDTLSTCWAPWPASCTLVENRALWDGLLDMKRSGASFHPRQIVRVSTQHLLDRLGGFTNKGFQALFGR